MDAPAKIDEELTLLPDDGRTTADLYRSEKRPGGREGALVRVMTRGTFEEAQHCWLIGDDASKIDATVRGVARLTVDSDALLAENFS